MPRKTYSEWVAQFSRDKKEVPAPSERDKYAVHSVKRFIDTCGYLWETAITYTGRIVVRTGKVMANGTSVNWGDWKTEHDVEIDLEKQI